MSLLNQVLQDLEKRNVNSPPAANKAMPIKTVIAKRKSSVYFLATLLGITALVIFITFKVFNSVKKPLSTEQTPAVSPNQPELYNRITHAKALPVKKTNIVPAIKAGIPKTKPKLSASKTNSIVADKKNKHKDHQIVTKMLIKPINNQHKAEQLFSTISTISTIKHQQNKIELQTTLKLILELNPKHLRARLLLANALLMQGLTAETTAVLEQGLELFSQNLPLINLRSQLYLQKKQAQKALALLQSVYPQSKNETYLSLLAAAYQQNHDNIKSLGIYQRLLEINPDQAKYWLGIAVAWEKQGEQEHAVNAYQQALNKNTLKPTIVNYIKQRISALK